MGEESADRGHHNIHYNQKHILKHLIIINWWMLGGCKVKRKIKGIYYSTRQRILGPYWSDSESWERAPRRSKIKIESSRQIELEGRMNEHCIESPWALIHSLRGRGWGGNLKSERRARLGLDQPDQDRKKHDPFYYVFLADWHKLFYKLHSS